MVAKMHTKVSGGVTNVRIRTKQEYRALILDELRSALFLSGANKSNYFDWHSQAFALSQLVALVGIDKIDDSQQNLIDEAFDQLLTFVGVGNGDYRALADFGISLREILSDIVSVNEDVKADCVSDIDSQDENASSRTITLYYEINFPLEASITDEEAFRETTVEEAMSAILDGEDLASYVSTLADCDLNDLELAGIFINEHLPTMACPACDIEIQENSEVCYSCSFQLVGALSGKLFAVASGIQVKTSSALEPFTRADEEHHISSFASDLTEKIYDGDFQVETNIYYKVLPLSFSRNLPPSPFEVFGY